MITLAAIDAVKPIRRTSARLFVWASATLAWSGCQTEEGPPLRPEPSITLEPAQPVLHRLTDAQYRNSIRDLLGESIVVPPSLEPDIATSGLLQIGASKTTISPWGVEQYEAAAFKIAQQALAEEHRGALVPCQPAGVIDLDCAQRFVTEFGKKVYRRPLTSEEVAPLVRTATTAAGVLADFHQGLEFALATMLQSPNFLFRVELGEADGEGRRYTSLEMATRLSYFIWNTTPDAQLLEAAESGALLTDEGLSAQVERLLASDRAKDGVRNFFTDLYELYELDHLSKDPTLYAHFSPDLGEAAREETLLGLEHLIFDKEGDFRDIFIADRTFVNRRLAAIYSVPAGSRDGFSEVELPIESGRRGLLGQVSFLALQSHAVSTSPTLRGLFVRQVLLCGEIPPPPVNVNTALPEPSVDARSLRERIEKGHLTIPACAGCHVEMDPIGLGLESFDGVGRFRTKDNEVPIDASGELDGVPFTDAYELAQVVRDHPDLGSCFVRNLYRYATGNVDQPGEASQLDWLTWSFERAEYRVKPLIREIAMSAGFRRTQVPE